MAEYIEREALMIQIAGVKIRLKGKSDWIVGYRDALQAVGEMVQKAKTADVVAVKRGRWENIVYNPVLRKMEATCSSCMCIGEIRVKGNCCGFVVPNSDFCPSCGADMREVSASED